MTFMTFRSVFIAVILTSALIVGGLILHSKRPQWELQQPGPQFVRATGKCAECHARETSAIVHEFELSDHAANGVTCLDCHQPRWPSAF
jgi:formate-dependent nitrite reductase cytochrome c552 subunit